MEKRRTARAGSGIPGRQRVAMIALAALAGCVSLNHPHWLESRWPYAPKDPKTCDQIGQLMRQAAVSNFTFSVIEFDEQGEMWNVEQKNEALRTIAKDPVNKPPLLFVFVHGWNNSSDPKSGNLVSFHGFLGRAALALTNHHVHGVYIGWNGASPVPIFNFWGRKGAAERMGGMPMTSVLMQLSRTVRNRDAEKGRSVFIGHSFGGHVLTLATCRAIEGQLLITNKPIAPADLTILLNPASPAVEIRRLKLMLGEREPGDAPDIVVLSSGNDWANRIYWPIGVGIPAFFDTHGYRRYRDNTNYIGAASRAVPQKLLYSRTAGQADMLVDFAVTNSATTQLETSAFAKNLIAATPSNFWATAEPTNSRANKNGRLNPVDTLRFQIPAFDTNSVWRYDMRDKNGVWVIRVPQDILKGHGGEGQAGGMFNTRMMDVCAALYRICNLEGGTRGEASGDLKDEATIGGKSR